jgi:hypothetical protein
MSRAPWRPRAPRWTGLLYGYKDSVRTSQETHCVSATKPNRLMLFREAVAVYCNRTEHTNTPCGHAEFQCVKAGGTYSDHWGFKELRAAKLLKIRFTTCAPKILSIHAIWMITFSKLAHNLNKGVLSVKYLFY